MLVTYRIESTSNWLRLINLSAKRAGERSAGNLHAPFDVAGDGNQLTVRLVRHSQRKRGAPDRSDLRSMAPFLDPTNYLTDHKRQIARKEKSSGGWTAGLSVTQKQPRTSRTRHATKLRGGSVLA